MNINNGWKSAPLGEICDVVIGKTPARQTPKYWGGENPWLSIGDMSQGKFISKTKEKITDAGVKECGCRLIEKGTLLLSFKLSIGKVGFAEIPLYTNEAIAALPIKRRDLVTAGYLYWALQNIDLDRYVDKAAKGKTLNKAKLREVMIPLPSLDEQKRIAAVLNKANALREKRQETIVKLDILLQSVFLDMFGDPVTNPKGWDMGVLGDVIFKATDGPHVSPTYASAGIPFLSTRHIKPGQILWEDLKFLSQEDAETHWRKCKPEKGDILYTKGGTTGIAKAIDFDREIAIWVHVAVLKTNHKVVDPLWLEQMLNSTYCYAQSQEFTHGIANRDLGLTRMVKIRMYIPPLVKQKEFASLAIRIRSLEKKQMTALVYLNDLFQSIQQRAFAGELFTGEISPEPLPTEITAYV